MNIKTKTLKIHKDNRGWLIENEVLKARKMMKHFLISVSKPGVVRGQHYHRRKREWFLIISGKGKIHFKDIKSGETHSVEVKGNDPQMVEIPPLVSHAIVNTGKKEMIILGIINEPLNKSDPDTYPFTVIQ